MMQIAVLKYADEMLLKYTLSYYKKAFSGQLIHMISLLVNPAACYVLM